MTTKKIFQSMSVYHVSFRVFLVHVLYERHSYFTTSNNYEAYNTVCNWINSGEGFKTTTKFGKYTLREALLSFYNECMNANILDYDNMI